MSIFSADPARRGFLRHLTGLAGLAAAGAGQSSAQSPLGGTSAGELPAYARAMNHRSLRQSSFDRTGGNDDYWFVPAGATRTVFESDGPGIISHIWFTIAADSPTHLKEIVLRAYWDGSTKPSIETPVGDFFGLNLGEYFLYQSVFLNCSSVKAMNSYFAMPFQKSARLTVTNEGTAKVGSFYSNIDYKMVPSLPEDMLYFHAQYRQASPNQAVKDPEGDHAVNLNGEHNYVFAETRGRGHLMGVTMGVRQNSDHWFGEGDDMIFVDDETKPLITGTGTEDFFNGAWDFGGPKTASVPFGYLYNGAPYMAKAEVTGGKYCLYRWHADNPVTFQKSLKHTIEHGHANNRGDNMYSVCYWYQSQPSQDFPALPPVSERIVPPLA